MNDQVIVRILPMKTAGTQHFIERTYREGGAFQWARETYKNAEEAGATRIEFGIEWQAAENLGVYRRVIADDGRGMTPEELVEFFNTFGGGGKPIGGLHENYGVGAKTSLLPWNREGIVVISWVDTQPSMIWVQRDPITGEYGLRLEEIDDGGSDETTLDEVYAPYEDDENGCDWELVKPEWMEDHGTVIVLLGNDGADDTVLGDPSRAESDIKGLSTYLNRRIWQIPGRTEVYVDELRTQGRGQWPRSEEMAHRTQASRGVDRRTNLRRIRGAEFYIDYPVKNFTKGKLAASGTIGVSRGTEVDWFLWDGDRPAVQSYAAMGGYIAALYENELYDVTQHQATYRSFGITERTVRSNVWLIIRPPLADDRKGHHGVYPRTDRNSLLVKGGPSAGDPLPINDWAADFATQMPDEIVDAIQNARAKGGGTITDTAWRERLADRFGSRWKIPKLRARKGGAVTVDAAQPAGSSVRTKVVKRPKRSVGGGAGGRGGEKRIGTRRGSVEAVRTRVAGGLPNYRAVRAGDGVSTEMLAAWSPNDPTEPAGVVLINVDHPVLREEIEHWQAQFPDHLAQQVGDEVIGVYGEMAVAKVAHSEHLKGLIPSKVVDDELRCEASLTMGLLGLIGEEAVLAPRIGGKFRKRKDAA